MQNRGFGHFHVAMVLLCGCIFGSFVTTIINTGNLFRSTSHIRIIDLHYFVNLRKAADVLEWEIPPSITEFAARPFRHRGFARGFFFPRSVLCGGTVHFLRIRYSDRATSTRGSDDSLTFSSTTNECLDLDSGVSSRGDHDCIISGGCRNSAEVPRISCPSLGLPSRSHHHSGLGADVNSDPKEV